MLVTGVLCGFLGRQGIDHVLPGRPFLPGQVGNGGAALQCRLYIVPATCGLPAGSWTPTSTARRPHTCLMSTLTEWDARY